MFTESVVRIAEMMENYLTFSKMCLNLTLNSNSCLHKMKDEPRDRRLFDNIAELI